MASPSDKYPRKLFGVTYVERRKRPVPSSIEPRSHVSVSLIVGRSSWAWGNAQVSCGDNRSDSGKKRVLVQSEMERGRSPLVRFRLWAGIFKAWRSFDLVRLD